MTVCRLSEGGHVPSRMSIFAIFPVTAALTGVGVVALLIAERKRVVPAGAVA